MSQALFTFHASRRLDVITLGRVTIDFNPVDFSRTFCQSERFAKYVGGSPANTAVGLARLGHSVGFVGKVSDDSLGDFAEQNLRENGVDVSQVSRCRNGETLGLAFTEILPGKGTNLMMYRNGPVADLQLSPDDIDEAYIADAKCVVISGTSLAASPSREAAFKALELARKHDCLTIFDIDYRPQTWRSKEETAVYYTLAARQAEIIMGSREEFDRMDALVAPASTDEETAKRWLARLAKVVLIKHGKEGSRAYQADGTLYLVKPFPVTLLKATGGGDAYSSAFISGLLQGKSLRDALEMGTASASMVVSRESCSASMPNRQELETFIRESKALHGEVITAR